MEAITYAMLSLYKPELSQKALKAWQPRKVFEELVNIDPYVEQGAKIEILDESTGRWISPFLGPEHRLTAKWAEKAHQALSNALHVPNDSGRLLAEDHYEKRVEKYLPEIEKTLGSESWHMMLIGETWSIKCDCGALLKRRKDLISSDPTFRCSECPRQYDSHFNETGSLVAELRKIIWTCNFCEASNGFPEYQLAEKYPS